LYFDSGKIGSTNHTQLKFQETHTCHVQDEFADILDDNGLQLEFSKQN